MAKPDDPIVLRARDLYLQDFSRKEIIKIIFEEFGEKVSEPTITNWKKRGNWDKDKSAIVVKATHDVSMTEADRIARENQRHLKEYDKIIEKGSDFLDVMPFFDSAMDAVRAVDVGIKGSRSVRAGMISLEFVEDVMGCVIKHINDEEVLKRIGDEMQTLVAKYSQMQSS